MLAKLSMRNARRQARDYLIYFITVTLSVAMIYAFNALLFSDEIAILGQAMDILPFIIVMASIVMIFVIGWLIHYTMGFMLKKRSREIGTWLLLGLERKQATRVFFVENLAVGGVALVFGFGAGAFVYQILRAVVVSLFGQPFRITFSFSLWAALLTLGYYLLIYLFALRKCRKQIARMNIHDLIYFERLNENIMVDEKKKRGKLFILSAVYGVLGMGLIIVAATVGGGAALVLPACILLVVFLYGFFISFASFVPGWFDRRPRVKYTGDNLFIYRNLSSKISTMGVTMATLSMVFLITIMAMGSGSLFNNLFTRRTQLYLSTDLYMSKDGQADFEEYLPYIEESIPVTAQHFYYVREDAGDRIISYIRDDLKEIVSTERDRVMAYSDYTRLREMLGYEPVALNGGQYLVHCVDFMKSRLTPFLTGTPDRTIAGTPLTLGGIYAEDFGQDGWNGNGNLFILVVADEIAAQLAIVQTSWGAMTAQPVTGEMYRGLEAIRDAKGLEEYHTMMSKGNLLEQDIASYMIVIFPLYYLALVFVMVAATILTVQQLSDVGQYRKRFGILSNLGVDTPGQDRMIRKQFLVYYMLPAIPAIVIGSVLLMLLAGAMDSGAFIGIGPMLANVGMSVGLFLAIYLIYIVAAHTSFKRNISTRT